MCPICGYAHHLIYETEQDTAKPWNKEFFLGGGGMAVLTANHVCKPWRREGVNATKSALPLTPSLSILTQIVGLAYAMWGYVQLDVLLLAFIFYLQYLVIIKMDKFFFKYVSKVKMVVKWNQFQLTLLTKNPCKILHNQQPQKMNQS